MTIGKTAALAGVWNSTAAFSLGNLIMFIQEIHLLQEKHNLDTVDIFVDLPNFVPRLEIFAAVFALSRNITTIRFSHDAQTHPKKAPQFVWPSPDVLHCSHTGSTKAIQELYISAPRFRRLTGDASTERSVVKYARARAEERMPIAVHLKNSPLDQKSNARLQDWLAFFRYAYELKYPYHFFLLGSENLDPFRGNSNVTVVRDDGLTLMNQLALIACSSAFMGMSSGPCNIALFSDIPYVIFKDPDHHTESMAFEMGREPRFSFSKHSQYFLREIATRDNLISSFQALQKHIEAA